MEALDKSSSPQDISRKVKQTGLTQNHAAVQLKSLLRADKWQEALHCRQLISIHESHLSLNLELLPVTNRAKTSLLQKSQANPVSCCRGVKSCVKPVAAACMGNEVVRNKHIPLDSLVFKKKNKKKTLIKQPVHSAPFFFPLLINEAIALLPKLNPTSICSRFPSPGEHSSASRQTSLKS